MEKWNIATLDIIKSKIFKEIPSKLKHKVPTNICKIFFDKKGVELKNLSRILHERFALSTLPSNTKRL